MTIFFTAGMPRSGSTLLQNILNQNPELHATATSPLAGILAEVRKLWDKVPENGTQDWQLSEDKKATVLRGILNNYYADVEKPNILDKSRYWPSLIELVETLTGQKAKVLITVRDMREILASWELLQRKHPLIHRDVFEHPQTLTVEQRINLYISANHPIGMAYNRIKDAKDRGLADRLHFVHFERLTNQPKTTLMGIYEFLDLAPFEHDLTNIEQTVVENDRVWGYPDLHTIRPTLTPVKSKWQDILGDIGAKYVVNWDSL